MAEIDWRAPTRGGIGQTYGYSKASTALSLALEDAGCVISEAAPVACQFTPGHLFDPVEGKINLLWTMYEADKLPGAFLDGIMAADGIIVPSKYNRDIFRAHGVVAPMAVCHLGIESRDFPYADRSRQPGERFRFLWLGAADIRKGWDLAVKAFQDEFKPYEPVELYVKTTATQQRQHFAMYNSKVHFDGRNLDEESIRKLYESAHAFVFPSRGEGFGLPPLEAMASGCLVIAPCHTGLAEFISTSTALVCETKKRGGFYGVNITVLEPKIDPLRRLMRRTYEHYDDTLPLRESGSRMAHGHFTWAHAASSLCEIVPQLIEELQPCAS